jgi:hypothetical protein
VSDISRPGYRAARAIAEYAATYGREESEARIRELVEQGIAETRALLDPAAITTMAIDLLTNPADW